MIGPNPDTRQDDALTRLLLRLKELGYRFITVTPTTHARVLARELDRPPTLRDVFGWSRPFRKQQLDPKLVAVMDEAGILLAEEDATFRSTLRVSSLGEDLFYHSAYPTEDADAVFFGPDTYRFARFIEQHLIGRKATRIVDMGAGSGAGGIFAGRLAPTASVTLVDMNPVALRLAGVNARAGGREVGLVPGEAIPQGADLVLANPPYMVDEGNRTYRDGGALFGGEVALKWARDTLAKLTPGGTMLLYTGAAVVDGEAPLLPQLAELCGRAGATLSWEEIDPDVFGEELDKPAYAEVERIAALGIVITASD